MFFFGLLLTFNRDLAFSQLPAYRLALILMLDDILCCSAMRLAEANLTRGGGPAPSAVRIALSDSALYSSLVLLLSRS